MTTKLARALHYLTRTGLALVFLLSGVLKFRDVPGFGEELGAFGIVHDAFVLPAAWAVCIVELVLGVAVLANVRGGLAAMSLLIAAFVCVLAYGIYLGLDIHCGCFGAGYHVSLKTQLLLDIGLLCLCGLTAWSRHRGGVPQVDPVAFIPRPFLRSKQTP